MYSARALCVAYQVPNPDVTTEPDDARLAIAEPQRTFGARPRFAPLMSANKSCVDAGSPNEAAIGEFTRHEVFISAH